MGHLAALTILASGCSSLVVGTPPTTGHLRRRRRPPTHDRAGAHHHRSSLGRPRPPLPRRSPDRPGMGQRPDHAAPRRWIHLALVHLGHLLRRGRRWRPAGIAAELTTGSGRGRVVGRGVVVRPLRLLPGSRPTGRSTPRCCPPSPAPPVPSCVIVDGSDHVSDGNGTTWSAPAPLPRPRPCRPNPTDPGPGHPGSRTGRGVLPVADLLRRRRQHRPGLHLGDGRWLAPRSPSGHRIGHRVDRLALPGRSGRGLVPDHLLMHGGGRHLGARAGTGPPGPRSRHRGPPSLTSGPARTPPPSPVPPPRGVRR